MLYRVVNIAYEVECKLFKKVPRMQHEYQFKDAYNEKRIIKAVDSTDGKIAGMILWETRGNIIEFGPLAVLPEYGGKGLGKTLINYVIEIAREKSIPTVEITVVNLRTELFTFYEKQGFVRQGTAEYPHPEKLTQPCHFVVYRKDL